MGGSVLEAQLPAPSPPPPIDEIDASDERRTSPETHAGGDDRGDREWEDRSSKERFQGEEQDEVEEDPWAPDYGPTLGEVQETEQDTPRAGAERSPEPLDV